MRYALFQISSPRNNLLNWLQNLKLLWLFFYNDSLLLMHKACLGLFRIWIFCTPSCCRLWVKSSSITQQLSSSRLNYPNTVQRWLCDYRIYVIYRKTESIFVRDKKTNILEYIVWTFSRKFQCLNGVSSHWFNVPWTPKYGPVLSQVFTTKDNLKDIYIAVYMWFTFPCNPQLQAMIWQSLHAWYTIPHALLITYMLKSTDHSFIRIVAR